MIQVAFMTASKKEIQDKLNTCASIVRKYNLGDSEYFFKQFFDIDRSILETAWAFALRKIQHQEIIKDAQDLAQEEFLQVNNIISKYNTADDIYNYLTSKFDVRELKLRDENIERRARKLLADTFLQIIAKDVSSLLLRKKKPITLTATTFLSKIKYALIPIVIVGIFFGPRIVEGLTPVDILTEKIHEKSKYKFNGSKCNDGTISHSQGRGTCSWHGGVDYKFYEGDYSKTLEECREEAIKLSWRD